MHEWDIRAGLEPDAQLSAASIPSILLTIGESIASGSLRWAFWSGPALPAPVRYRFIVTGANLTRSDVLVDGNTLRMDEPQESTANVTVHCDAATYVLLVYGRLNLEAALDSGRLVVVGDPALVLDFGQWFRGI